MQVDNIQIGTVVDHIPSGKGAKVIKLLEIDENYPHRVAIMLHVPSKKMKTKDIVKIEGKIVSEKIANILALIAPGATINIIKNGKVEKKISTILPEEISIGNCPNPTCISKDEGRRFIKDEGKYRCYYCEKTFDAKEIL